MPWPSKKWIVACTILVASSAFAGKKEKEEEGRALLGRASQLSDIRAAGAPAFRLKGRFKVIREDSTAEGTYTETWLSRGQWRRETVLGDMHRTVVANGQSRWTANGTLRSDPAWDSKELDNKSDSLSLTGISEAAFLIETLTNSEFWRADKVEDREIRSLPARCLETKADSMGRRSALCFAKDKGLLLAKAVPRQIQNRIVESVCEYRDYQDFGGKTFPRQILCFDGRKPVFEESVVELTAEPSPDPALFAPPPGATASTNCQGVVKPPVPDYTPDPELPRRETPKNPVDLQLSVGVDGNIRDLKVVQSVDEAFDRAAVKAVKKWRFRPATCDGVPIETMISVSVSFKAY